MSTMSLQAQIDHVEAACLALQDAIDNGDQRVARGKPADPLRPLKVSRLNGFRTVMATLAWIRDNEAAINAALSPKSEAA